MRIQEVDLSAFAPSTDKPLDFSGGAEGLHLVFGPNEAGKSTALRAIQQFFTKIDPRSTYGFNARDNSHHKELRIGLTIRARDGATHKLIRRKGNKNTLLRADNTPEDEAAIARLLGGLSVDDFLRKSVIDHAELVAGGKAMIAGNSDLGETLFAAGAAFVGVKGIRKKLDDDAEELYKFRGTNPKINAALARWKELKEKLDPRRSSSLALSSAEWSAKTDERDDALRRKDELGHALEEAAREQRKLDSLRKAIAPARQRARLTAELASLADVPRLRPNFRDARVESQAALSRNENTVEILAKQLEKLRDDLQAIQLPSTLLAVADDLNALYERRGPYVAQNAARGRAELDYNNLLAEARTCLKTLGLDPALLDDGPDASILEALRPAAANRGEVRDLLKLQRSSEQAATSAEEALNAHDLEQERLRAERAALGPSRDGSLLKKAINKAKKLGEPEKDRDELRRKLARDEKSAAKDLKHLEHWSGTLEDLETLTFPSIDIVEAFRVELQQANAAVAGLREKLQALDDEARQTAAELERLRLGGDVPTADELRAARQRRDELWNQFTASRTWNDALAEAIATVWQRIDDLSDRLRLDADRAAQRANLTAETGRQDAQRTAFLQRIAEASAALDEVQARWKARWTPSGVTEPGNPAEMRGWLDRRAKLTEKSAALGALRGELERLDALIAAHRQPLSEALAGLGEPPTVASESLADLIERSDQILEALRIHENRCEQLRQQIHTNEKKRDSLVTKRDAALSDRASLETRRAALAARLGLAADTAPAVAEAILQERESLFSHLDAARRRRRELDSSLLDAERFTADVRALALRIAPDLAQQREFVPADVLQQLHERLDAARRTQTHRDHLENQLREREAALENARSAVTEHERALGALCVEAGCATPGELLAIENRAALRDRSEEECRKLDQDLTLLAGTTPLLEFLNLAKDADPDALDTQLERNSETIAEQRREHDACIATAARLNEQLKLMNGNANAAELAQEIADLEAKIKQDAEQYAVLRLASVVLGEGIERYRQKVQGPVLARASDFLTRFTLGSFSKLEADYDKDELVLLGVRPGGQKIPVSAMSLGTADQLYLALRLATLEVDLAQREPLPLVIDDVLIQFDDARAAATLSVLAELSRRTQVLVFTHHRHLKEIAATTVPAADLFCHDLPNPLSALQGALVVNA